MFDLQNVLRSTEKELEKARLEEELAKRKRPLKDKIVDLVEITREGGSSAAVRHISQGLKNRAMDLPDKIPSREVVLAKSKHLLQQSKDNIVRLVVHYLLAK